MTTGPPPGWYPDPSAGPPLPIPPMGHPRPPRPRPTWTQWLVAVLVISIAVVVGLAVFRSTSAPNRASSISGNPPVSSTSSPSASLTGTNFVGVTNEWIMLFEFGPEEAGNYDGTIYATYPSYDNGDKPGSTVMETLSAQIEGSTISVDSSASDSDFDFSWMGTLDSSNITFETPQENGTFLSVTFYRETLHQYESQLQTFENSPTFEKS
jgi:hypothetical protein